jgi:hypothetical protein
VEAEEILEATLEARQRVLGNGHPDTIDSAQCLEGVRRAIMITRAERTQRGGKAVARRSERAAAPALSPTALADADARARAAEAELLAMLDLDEAGGGGSGSAKAKAKAKAKCQGGKR